MTKPYTVNLWGSHPEAGNDDCWTGADFDTREEAEAVFADPLPEFSRVYRDSEAFSADVAYVQIDGPDVHRERKNHAHRPQVLAGSDSEWREEIAREAGMLHGLDAYNDVRNGGR